MGKSGFARANLVLSFLGVYIASMLSLSHLLGIQLPCGTGAGCGLVTNDRHSFFLGLPIAYYGLAAYLGFLVVSGIRLFAPGFHPRAMHTFGYLASFVGVLVSIALTLYSTRVLHAVCAWCIGSAVTLSLLLVSHALEASQIPGFAQPRRSPANGFLLACLVLITSGGLVMAATKLQRGVTVDKITRRSDAPQVPHLNGLSDAELLPPGVHIEGPAEAHTTLLMFGDLTCPVCQEAYTKFSALLKQRHDFRFAFRHLPLQMHPFARPSALLSELAAEKGKFWQYADAAYNFDADSLDGYQKLLIPLGVDLAEAKRRTKNESDPAFNELHIDDAETAKLGLDTTPTMYLVADGFYPARTSIAALGGMLDDIQRQRATSP